MNDITPCLPPMPDLEFDSQLDSLIEAWFIAAFHNSSVSRASDIFNHVRVAVDDLKQRLKETYKETDHAE